MAKEKQSENKNLLDTIKAISQVMANSYDGALDDEGKPIKIGLNREVDNIVTDSRMVDGFSFRVQGQHLIVSYHEQIVMTQLHDKKFEKDIEGIFADIIKHLKKQFKTITKKTLGLKEEGKAQVKVETMNAIRSWAIAKKIYKITSIELEKLGDDKPLEKSIKNWLELKTEKKPKNVEIKKGDNDKEEK